MELHPQLVARYYQWFGPQAKMILDLGCGDGSLGRHKSDPTLEVVGIESNEKTLEEAAAYERVIRCDLEQLQLPLRDGLFDGVLAKDVLEHVQRPWKILKEVRRVMKPGGMLIVSVPLPHAGVVWNDYTHVRGFTKQALQKMLEDAGFSVLRIGKMGGIPGFGRLNLVRLIPALLAFPGVGSVFASSWEAVASKRDR